MWFKGAEFDYLSPWMRRHSPRPIYQCPICGEAFSERIDLNRHAVREHHGAGRSFRCPVCGQIFASRQRFLRHRARAHAARAEHAEPVEHAAKARQAE